MDDQDIITLGSDDEGDPYMAADLIVGPSGKALPFKKAQNQPFRNMPLPPSLQFNAMNFSALQEQPRVPKKPGAMTPFILFSQEQREQLLSVHKNLRFGEIGKKMGEMWRALTEEEKEDYRARARLCGEKRLKEWQEKVKDLPPQPSAPVGNIKPRRTHGYAIFSSELRRKLDENLLMSDKTKIIAEKWRNASPSLRELYENKAARINQIEINRARQMMIQGQRNQMQFQQAQRQQQALQMRNGGFQSNLRRQLLVQNTPNLKISSVSSLRQSQALATSSVNLPSSITISRIEPEVSHVEESASMSLHKLPPGLSIQKMRGPPPLTRNEPLAFRQGQTIIQRGHPQQQHQQQHHQQLQLRQNPAMRQMRPMANLGAFNAQRNVLLKRQMQGGMMSGILNKQPRMVLPPPPLKPQMPTHLLQKAKICRLCAQYSPFSFPLKSKPDTLQAIKFALDMNIDFEVDKQKAYPDNICRRCCTVLTTFSQFRKTYETGQMRLKTIIENKKKSALETQEGDSSEMSILPDLDCEMDFGVSVPMPVSIKQEKVFSIVPDLVETEVGLSANEDIESVSGAAFVGKDSDSSLNLQIGQVKSASPGLEDDAWSGNQDSEHSKSNFVSFEEGDELNAEHGGDHQEDDAFEHEAQDENEGQVEDLDTSDQNSQQIVNTDNEVPEPDELEHNNQISDEAELESEEPDHPDDLVETEQKEAEDDFAEEDEIFENSNNESENAKENVEEDNQEELSSNLSLSEANISKNIHEADDAEGESTLEASKVEDINKNENVKKKTPKDARGKISGDIEH